MNYQIIIKLPESYRYKLKVIGAVYGESLNGMGLDLFTKLIQAYEEQNGEIKTIEKK